MRDFLDERDDYYYPKAGSGFFVLLTGLTLGFACAVVWMGAIRLIAG